MRHSLLKRIGAVLGGAAAPLTDPCRLNIGPPGANVQLASLVYDHTADSLVLADGALVTSWADSAGNGHTATRAAATAPSYASMSIPGGGPCVRFLAATKGLSIAGMALNLRAAATLYWIVRYTPNQATFGALLQAQSGSGGFIVQPDDAPGDTVDVFYGGNPFTAGPPAVCGWECLAVTADFAGNALKTYRNGVQIQTQGFAPTNEATSAWVTGSTVAGGDGFIFDLAQQQLYSAVHSAAIVLSQSLALRARWNIKANQGV